MFTTSQPYSLLLAIKHLQTQRIKFPRVIVHYGSNPNDTKSIQADPTPEKSVIARLSYLFATEENFEASVLTCVKANLKFNLVQKTQNDVGFSKETFALIQQLIGFVEGLDIGLSQPSPHIYSSMLNISEGCHQPIKELLRRYWHPELIIDELTNPETSVVKIQATISLPPNSPTEKVFEILKERFGEYQPVLESKDPGFLSENPKWLCSCLE